MASAVTSAIASASRRLRQVQEDLRKILADDQENPQLGSSVGDALHHVDDQLDRLAGLQELFEWYSRMP